MKTGIKIFLLLALRNSAAKNQEGDSCVESHTSVIGRCLPPEKCISARNDLQLNGISPTFCRHSFEQVLVCCRDGNSILKTAQNNAEGEDTRRSLDPRRVSERKCEEYSQAVTQLVDILPLLPDPEVLTVSSANCNYTGVELIVGGEDALQGEFPHMAAIGWADFDGYKFNCGGSLISPKFVLTAAHCTKLPTMRDPLPTIVRLGDQNLDPSVKDGADPIEVPIKAIHKHPDYKPPMRYNDIALLELAADVDFENSIRPACLWPHPGFGGHGKAIATGWGVTRPGDRTPSKELQKVSLMLMENDMCDLLLLQHRNRYWNGFVNGQLCAGELQGRKDTCQGDSGSALQVSSNDNQCIFYVMGVTSFGHKCAQSGQPAVYTRVSAYLDWIESIVWPRQ